MLLQQKPLTRESARVFPPELVGIGIALDLNEQSRTLRITKVFPNSPAARAGLSPGLIIRRIGDVPLAGKGLAECMKLLRGNVGTKVTLELLDPDGKSRTVELTRQKILITR
jgi:carboxyl-terminal processing protease